MGLNFKDLVIKKEIAIKDLVNKTLAVDTYNLLYQFLTTIRNPDGSLFTDSQGRATSHLIGLFNRTTKLMESGIKLIFVFDGEPPPIKQKTKEKRGELKREAALKLKEAEERGDIEEMHKFASRTASLTLEMVEEAKKLIGYLGLPIVQAPSEGEAECAYLVKEGKAYASVSQDYDSLVFGCPLLVRNLSIEGRRKKMGRFAYETIKPEIISLGENLNNLGLELEQLIVLATLVGSVDCNEPTFVCDDNTIKIIPMGKFCDSIKNYKNIKVPCFSHKTKKITFHPLLKAIKHKITEPLYEIKLSYGRSIRVTASHSLFGRKEGKIRAIKTTALKPGDELVIPIKIPHSPQPVKQINLACELWENRKKMVRKIYCFGDKLSEILKERLLNKKRKKHQINEPLVVLTKEGIKKIKELRLSQKIPQGKVPLVSESSVYSWEKRRQNPTLTLFKKYLRFLKVNPSNFLTNKLYVYRIEPSTLEKAIQSTMGIKSEYHPRIFLDSLKLNEVRKLTKKDKLYGFKKNAVSSILKITPELIRLMGYYVAEGSLCGNYRISFNFGPLNQGHENKCVKDVCYCIKKVFGVQPFVYNERTGRHICVDNIVIYSFFAHFLGFDKKNSHTKRIPQLIFNITPQLQLEFLEGYFLGDGTLGGGVISFATRSKNLANDLNYLFLQLGTVTSCSFLGKKHYNMNNITICGKENLQKLKKIWFKHNKTRELIKYCKKPFRKSRHLKKDNDLGFVKIKSIRKVKSSNKYVYDFSVKGENFIAGFGGVCCHNTDYNPGGIKGIGPKKALKLVKENPKDFELIFQKGNWGEFFPDLDWKEVFYTIKKMGVSDDYSLDFQPVNEKKVIEFLVKEHDFSEERVKSKLAKLIKEKEKQGQKGLGSFF